MCPLPPHPPRDIALALSGGGYRAAIFNLGVLRKLDELGLLDRVAVVSSVSGGSIVAGAYARSLLAGEPFQMFLARTVEFLHGSTLDVPALLGGLVPWRSSSMRLERAFQRLLGDHRGRPVRVGDLGALDGPRFLFNATAVHSGRGWRFVSGGTAEEWELAQGHDAAFVASVDRYECDVPLARAVAASAAFPLFSAVTIARAQVRDLPDPSGSTARRLFQDLTDPVCLVDGGVRDNTGLASIVAGHAPPGFEDDYYLIGSDAGATLSLVQRPPRGRIRKLHYVLRQFDVLGRHNNQLTVAMVLGAHRARRTSEKGMAMLRIDEAVVEAGEQADRIGKLVGVKTRLKSPGKVVGAQLMGHGETLLWARLSEYTDLLEEGRRMSVPRRRHKDVTPADPISRGPEAAGIARLLTHVLSASPEVQALRFEPFDAARFAARIEPVLRDVLGCLGDGLVELDETVIHDGRATGSGLTAVVRYRLAGRIHEAGVGLVAD